MRRLGVAPHFLGETGDGRRGGGGGRLPRSPLKTPSRQEGRRPWASWGAEGPRPARSLIPSVRSRGLGRCCREAGLYLSSFYVNLCLCG